MGPSEKSKRAAAREQQDGQRRWDLLIMQGVLIKNLKKKAQNC